MHRGPDRPLTRSLFSCSFTVRMCQVESLDRGNTCYESVIVVIIVAVEYSCANSYRLMSNLDVRRNSEKS